MVTHAQVDSSIALYAIGVFTGFTMAGAGMAKYHLTHQEDHWRRRLAINGTAAVLSAIVLLIFAVTKFTEGAWVVWSSSPSVCSGSCACTASTWTRNGQLEEGAADACEAPVLRRHMS